MGSQSSTSFTISSDPNDGQTKAKRRRSLTAAMMRHGGSSQRQSFSQSKLPFALVSLLIFGVICGAGIAMSSEYDKAKQQDLYDEVSELAVETGDFFSKELDRAILPLFSMSQFAAELDTFRNLPDDIGPAFEDGSLPFQSTSDGSPSYKRNVTGVCDRPELLERFNEIAATIKTNAQMDGVLHNIQLAPEGVICLLYPLINTEDFDNATENVLDNRGALGIDLLHDPFHKYIATQSLLQETIGIVGPRRLTQCPSCGLYFIVRLPVLTDHHQMVVNGESVNRWGFTTALIQWDRLIERSAVYNHFESRGFEFQLTRTDRNLDEATQTFVEDVVVISQSTTFGTKKREVTTALQTTNNEWVLKIWYNYDSKWYSIYVSVTVVVLAACISVLVYVILSQKQSMLGTTMAQDAKVDMERSMTAYFAHELRNPLSGIDSALVAMPDHLPSEVEDLVSGMRLCSSMMSSIMSNLLDVRKIEEGKMILLEEALSLSSVLDDVHRMLAPTINTGVDFSVVVNTKGKDRVLGDVHRLQQVISNITSNAIKYTTAGSVKLVVGWEHDHVVFECQDSGPGIPKEEQKHMFDRFVQRGGVPGAGLGLAIAKKLVDLMEGDIRFESDPTVEAGTTCVVTLPLQAYTEDQKAEEVKMVTDTVEPLQEPITILLVDDIKINRTMLKRRLSKGVAPNCIISEAATGEQAIKACENAVFDVIIMDQYMEAAGGVMVGTDAIIALRRMKSEALVIGCSGNDLDAEFRLAGADLVWKKPMPPNTEIIVQLKDHIVDRTTHV